MIFLIYLGKYIEHHTHRTIVTITSPLIITSNKKRGPSFLMCFLQYPLVFFCVLLLLALKYILNRIPLWGSSIFK